MPEPLIDGVRLARTDHCIHMQMDRPRQVLSSAVLGGGWGYAEHFVNLKVEAQDYTPAIEHTPQQTLRDYCHRYGWKGDVVGMMTAASMRSLSVERVRLPGVDFCVLLTSGIENARRAGDSADYEHIYEPVADLGTINVAVVSSALLTPAAMVEAVMIVTEAKAAALQDRNVLSPVSQRVATGTGTDSVAFFNGEAEGNDYGAEDNYHGADGNYYGAEGSRPVIEYCGKHTLVGEHLAAAVIAALKSSLDD